MAAPILVPLGIASALLLANLSLNIQPAVELSDNDGSVQTPLIFQIGHWTIPLQISADQDGQSGRGNSFSSSSLFGTFSADHTGGLLHLDCRSNGTNITSALLRRRFCRALEKNGQSEVFLLIGPATGWPPFLGCVHNVALDGRLLLAHWCRHHRRTIRNVRLLDAPQNDGSGHRVVETGERLVVRTAGQPVPIQWFHLRPLNLNRIGRNLGNIPFEVVEGPRHGRILVREREANWSRAVHRFSYADVLSGRVFYQHSDAEPTAIADSFTLKVDLRRVARKAARRLSSWNLPPADSLTLQVDNVQRRNNTAPQLMLGPNGPIVHVKPASRVQLGEAHLRMFDPDTAPDRVWLHVEEMSSNLDLVDRAGMRLRRFSLVELDRGEVLLLAADEADDEMYAASGQHPQQEGGGHVTFVARDDAGGQSSPVTLHVTFWPLKVLLDRNTGIRLAHHSSQLIEPSQLHSRCANQVTNQQLPNLLAHYSIVDQPEFGVVECSRKENLVSDASSSRWVLCSEFSQADIDSLAVRYRHTNANRSRADDFGFQVRCADSNSPVQLLQIDFTTISIRLFVQEALTLNQTDQATLSRKNMLATVFPQHFRPDQLVYHLVEAPKLGMLLRLLPETGRQRRVGISSNFTQQQVEDGQLSYKLHFAPFSVLNDFFTFRLLTPAGPSDETFRFDIVYLPGGGFGEIRLLNRTLVVPEGGTQQISNATLWLEAANGSREFTFRLCLPPLNGRLLVQQPSDGVRRPLDFDGTFKSEDILNHRLYYEHSGEAAARWDRAFLQAESDFRDPGGGKGHTPVPFFLSVSIVNANNRSPQFRQTAFGKTVKEQHVHLLENGERTLWPSLLPLVDFDELEWPASLEQSPFFPVAKPRNPLSFHVLPEATSSSRDFVISDKGAPEMPLREFYEDQLKSGSLILRHLGGARNATLLRLSVNDGRHSTAAPIWMSASPEPFLRLATSNQLIFPLISTNNGKKTFLLITFVHLWAETNVDVPDSAILFQFHSLLQKSPFHLLLQNGSFVETQQFSQKEIWENQLFYAVEDEEHLDVDVDTQQTSKNRSRLIFVKLMIDPALKNVRTPEAVDLVLNVSFGNADAKSAFALPISINNYGLTVQKAGSAPIDETLLGITLEHEALNTKFYIVRGPKHGRIIFQRQKRRKDEYPSANYNIPLLSFDTSILRSGSLQYLHTARSSDGEELDDGFLLKMMIQKNDVLVQFNSLFIPVHIVEENQLRLITVPQLSIESGNNLKLDENLLRLESPSADTSRVEFVVKEKSKILTILNRRNGRPINVFSYKQLSAGDVQLTTNLGAKNQRAEIVLRACDKSYRLEKCSWPPVKLSVLITGSNEGNALVLKRNNLVKIQPGEQIAGITSEKLQVERSNTPTNQIHFLAWQQQNGFLKLKDSDQRINNFTQEDLDNNKIQFKITDSLQNKFGFYFLYSDEFTQKGPKWFEITKENAGHSIMTSANTETGTLRLERNQLLRAAPGIPTEITSDVLKTNGKIHPAQIIYRLSKPPTHGRLQLSGSSGKVEQFTQADIDANRLIYKSQQNIGSWTQLDQFRFKLAVSDSGNVAQQDGDFMFQIENSYSNIPLSKLADFVPQNVIRVSRGGSVALNESHINLTRLAEFVDDDIFLHLHRKPAQGWLERMDEVTRHDDPEMQTRLMRKRIGRRFVKKSGESGIDAQKWNLPLEAGQLHSGNYLIYRHVWNQSSHSVERMDGEDEFTLIAYGSREPHNGLKIFVKIQITEAPSRLKVIRFPKEMSLVSGGTLRLNSDLLSAYHPALPPSKIFYQITQQPKNGIRLSNKSADYANTNIFPLEMFNQQQINEQSVVIEHIPMEESKPWDLIGLKLTEDSNLIGHSLVLVVRIEPLALQLRNFTEIKYQQGKTYVLLDRSHLGAESNGDRSLITYNVTKRPENGTFYWVDGEKEATSFSQVNIDKGEVLYAQMNMNAFQDSFEFVLSNDEIELLPKKGILKVVPLVQPQTFLTNSRTITRIGLSYLNASMMEGSSPRYVVIEGPKYGRFFLHPQSNESVTFFLHSDVAAGRLFFHAFNVPKRTMDSVILELRSDSVQPARIEWQIDIKPSDKMENQEAAADMSGVTDSYDLSLDGITSIMDQNKVIIPPPPPEMNFHFPIAILVAVVCLVIGILLCRKKSTSDESSDNEDDGDHKSSRSNGNGRESSLKSSLKRKAGEDTGKGLGMNRLQMGGPSSSVRNMRFDERGNDVKNLLDATVYATVNYRQSKDHHMNSNFYSQNAESASDEGDKIADIAPAFPVELPVINSSFDTYSAGTLGNQRRNSSKNSILNMTISRSNSKEQQQLLAAAVSSALASRNSAQNDRTREENQQNEKIEGAQSTGTKNEFWV